jgi:3-hydroxyacyl-CoA dehydrogenase/enoyl-CoA hydratase/3-hydroxybutyryl-CoA epimerase
MYKHFSVKRDPRNVAIVTIDRQGEEMNLLSQEVLEELEQIAEQLTSDTELEGVVLVSGKEGNFVAGADINQIAGLKTSEAGSNGSRRMQEILQKIADLTVPTVAAIDGACLGGGLELALSCDWRVVTSDSKTKLGLPEIQLGLIPGAGGTQRLPRLIGIEQALDMILTGKNVAGRKALKLGLADACVPQTSLMNESIKFALRKKEKKPAGKISREIGDLSKWAIEGNPIGRKVMYRMAREKVDAKTKGFYPASYRALEAVFDGFDMSLKNGLRLESRLFGDLVTTRESQSLIHLFHATTKAKKHAYRDAVRERFGKRKFSVIGVVGAGFMGAGVAAVCSEKNIRVRISDPNKESIARAYQYVNDFFLKKLKRRRIKEFEKDHHIALISPGFSPVGFNKCDVVIEAVFEDLNLKSTILKKLEEQNTHPDWIFASNTSAIPISEIAKSSKFPERICGMHFFSPVEKMPLLEVVVTPKTADWVTGRAVQLGLEMGKQVIVVKDGPGFYTTRALAFFLAEATKILLEGAKIEDIDSALTDFGFPVGPITLIDEVGIDIGIHVLSTVEKAFPDRLTAPPALQSILESGRLGRKNSKGFYLYQNGKKTQPDERIYELLNRGEKEAIELQADEIIDRCLLLFVNESARCLEEGILSSPYDGDIGAVFGLGFPPFQGGPFKYVDFVGAQAIVESLKRLQDKYGERFRPAEILVELAKSNGKFFAEETWLTPSR